MKNVIKTMMVVGVFALFAFAPVGVTEVTTAPVVEPVEVACASVNEEVACVEDDALWCKIYKNGVLVARCFICNCSELAEAIL